MEIKIVSQGSWRPSCLGRGSGSEGGIGMDVLKGVGVDDGGVLGWEDVFIGEWNFFRFGLVWCGFWKVGVKGKRKRKRNQRANMGVGD